MQQKMSLTQNKRFGGEGAEKIVNTCHVQHEMKMRGLIFHSKKLLPASSSAFITIEFYSEHKSFPLHAHMHLHSTIAYPHTYIKVNVHVTFDIKSE